MSIEETYELAYREAVRALEHQRAESADLRARAGMLLATASITVCCSGVAADAQALLGAQLTAGEPSTASLSLDFIAHHAAQRTINARRLARLARSFRIGSCLLAMQIVLTIVAAGFTV